jgi:MSHA biogenesis protein MshO
MKKTSGFTLIELIVAMVIVGIVAGIAILFVGPAFRHYAAAERRAMLTHLADGALRRIVTEVHTAVPNSLRQLNGCLEMVPTTGGGRYRTAPDPRMAAGGDELDMSQPDNGFDTITDLDPLPAGGDFVVIGNVNGGDVYTGDSRAVISGDNPPAAGVRHITLKPAKQFPFGYTGGRFVVVSKDEQAVTYACTNVGTVNGAGTGKLVRINNYGFSAQQQCPPPGAGDTVASKVSRCSIVYTPPQGAVAQSGFVQLQLTLTDGGESVSMTVGAHVENAP